MWSFDNEIPAVRDGKNAIDLIIRLKEILMFLKSSIAASPSTEKNHLLALPKIKVQSNGCALSLARIIAVKEEGVLFATDSGPLGYKAIGYMIAMMKLSIKCLSLATSTILLLGCAGSYQTIKPQQVGYERSSVVVGKEGIVIAWRHNVLREAGNTKYARKERRMGVSLVAVNINNKSADTLCVPSDIMVFSGEDTLEVLTLTSAYFALCQDVYERRRGIGMADPVIIMMRDDINHSTQSRANTIFINELNDNYLFQKCIEPGGALKGLMCLNVKSGAMLRFFYSKT